MIELAIPLASAAVCGVGTWYWLQTHSHPELVPRAEIDLLRSLIESNHQAVLRELSQLRESLSRSSHR